LDFLKDHPYYKKVRGLSHGSFGVVHLAKDMRYRPPRDVAVKFIRRGSKVTKYVEAEILNHRMLIHPHIIQFKEVFLTKEHLCIAMEYAPGGDLFRFIVQHNCIPEKDARWLFQQLILAVDYCHKKGIANRDIKLQNLLLTISNAPLLKVCDFGYSKCDQWQSYAKTKVGTAAYLAPEVVSNPAGQTYDGKISDIWSCGVVLYFLLVGAYPFERPDDRKQDHKDRVRKMLQRIVDVDIFYPFKILVSNEVLDLLMRIFVSDPAKRITIDEIKKHPWFLRNLPDGAMEMNSTALESPLPRGTQTEREIKEIVKEAKIVPDIQSQIVDDLDAYFDHPDVDPRY